MMIINKKINQWIRYTLSLLLLSEILNSGYGISLYHGQPGFGLLLQLWFHQTLLDVGLLILVNIPKFFWIAYLVDIYLILTIGSSHNFLHWPYEGLEPLIAFILSILQLLFSIVGLIVCFIIYVYRLIK